MARLTKFAIVRRMLCGLSAGNAVRIISWCELQLLCVLFLHQHYHRENRQLYSKIFVMDLHW